ncbi:MAG: DUF502 domain-containing protein [Verrucomicrobiota bacterium]
MGTVWLLTVIYRVLLAVGENIIYGVVRVLDWLRGVRFDGEGKRADDYSESLTTWQSHLPQEDHPVWFLIPILLLGLVGLAVTNRPGQAFVNWVDRGITRVPFMGFLYSTLKQGVDAFRNLGGPRKFKGVAYVEYPSPGCRLLGFVTGTFLDSQSGKEVTSVFIPTSPNPMTGFVVVVDEDRVIDSDLSVEEATKLLLSAGLVAPEKVIPEVKMGAESV